MQGSEECSGRSEPVAGWPISPTHLASNRPMNQELFAADKCPAMSADHTTTVAGLAAISLVVAGQ